MAALHATGSTSATQERVVPKCNMHRRTLRISEFPNPVHGVQNSICERNRNVQRISGQEFRSLWRKEPKGAAMSMQAALSQWSLQVSRRSQHRTEDAGGQTSLVGSDARGLQSVAHAHWTYVTFVCAKDQLEKVSGRVASYTGHLRSLGGRAIQPLRLLRLRGARSCYAPLMLLPSQSQPWLVSKPPRRSLPRKHPPPQRPCTAPEQKAPQFQRIGTTPESKSIRRP